MWSEKPTSQVLWVNVNLRQCGYVAYSITAAAALPKHWWIIEMARKRSIDSAVGRARRRSVDDESVASKLFAYIRSRVWDYCTQCAIAVERVHSVFCFFVRWFRISFVVFSVSVGAEYIFMHSSTPHKKTCNLSIYEHIWKCIICMSNSDILHTKATAVSTTTSDHHQMLHDEGRILHINWYTQRIH